MGNCAQKPYNAYASSILFLSVAGGQQQICKQLPSLYTYARHRYRWYGRFASFFFGTWPFDCCVCSAHDSLTKIIQTVSRVVMLAIFGSSPVTKRLDCVTEACQAM